jgi:hypothetical protein
MLNLSPLLKRRGDFFVRNKVCSQTRERIQSVARSPDYRWFESGSSVAKYTWGAALAQMEVSGSGGNWQGR